MPLFAQQLFRYRRSEPEDLWGDNFCDTLRRYLCRRGEQTQRSVVVNQTEFIIVNEKVDFETAKKRCTQRDATLARISTIEEHEAVSSLMDSFKELGPENNVWIGRMTEIATN